MDVAGETERVSEISHDCSAEERGRHSTLTKSHKSGTDNQVRYRSTGLSVEKGGDCITERTQIGEGPLQLSANS